MLRLSRALALVGIVGLLTVGCASVGVRTIGQQHIKVEIGEPCPTPTPEGAK